MVLRPRISLLALTCATISACAPVHPADTTRHRPTAGAYSTHAGGDREFADAATFAAREESRRSGTPIHVVKIVRRESQVVAGTNLRLRILALRNGATPETADVVVFRDLFGGQQLTSWRWRGR